MAWLRDFVRDDGAQDLVEYAYLCVLIGIVGILAWAGIVNAMESAYSGYDSGVQSEWEPCDPGGC